MDAFTRRFMIVFPRLNQLYTIAIGSKGGRGTPVDIEIEAGIEYDRVSSGREMPRKQQGLNGHESLV